MFTSSFPTVLRATLAPGVDLAITGGGIHLCFPDSRPDYLALVGEFVEAPCHAIERFVEALSRALPHEPDGDGIIIWLPDGSSLQGWDDGLRFVDADGNEDGLWDDWSDVECSDKTMHAVIARLAESTATRPSLAKAI